MDEFKVPGQEIAENGVGEVNGLPAKIGMWDKFKAFWLQDVTVELTPKQQEFEDKLNDFFGQELTFKSFKKFLFSEVKFGK